MAYTQARAVEFWYQFDLATNPGFGGVSQDTNDLYLGVYGGSFDLDGLVDEVRDALNAGDLAPVAAGREQALRGLAAFQKTFFDEHFPDPDDLRRAFEDFGHGILHDNKKINGRNRRPAGFMNHMMDGSPSDCVGFHRWHAFIRAAVAAGADSERWLYINRIVGLSWAIYSELSPIVDSPSNSKLASSRVRTLREHWTNSSEDVLNAAFLAYEGSFPTAIPNRRAPPMAEIKYRRVQRILGKAAMARTPRHDGNGRFWELPMAQFLSTTVYGNPVVAPAGANRGNRSALVQVLRGELPGFGRMPPFPMPGVSQEDIEFIRSWIDNL